MKKNLKLILICASVVVIVAAVVAAVTLTRKTALPAPSSITYDEDDNLNWSKVDKASSYEVSLTNVDSGEKISLESSKESISLSSIEEGDYSIKVKSQAAKGSKYKDSDWNELEGLFRKYHETGCLYTLTDGGASYKLTKVGSANGSFEIEGEYRGKPVVEIADSAFKGSSRVTNIIIGDGIEKIGSRAFYSCTKLESVTIPDSVTEIGELAFRLCGSLISIKLPANLETIEKETFNYCRKLETVVFNENLKTIGEGAFSNCYSLDEIVIPDSVILLGESAFSNCYDSTSIKGIKKVTIGAELSEIPASAFSGCENLETVIFADNSNLKSIKDNAFYNCKKITGIELPEGLETIGASAFWYCGSLENIEIPTTVNTIERYAFFGTKMYNANILAATDTEYVYVDNWLVDLGDSFAENIESVNVDSLKNGTVGIAANAFISSKKLRSVVLPSSVKYIGKYAFADCANLDLFNSQSSSLLYIGKYSFYKDVLLKRLYLNEGLKIIDDYAFYDCTNVSNGNNSIIPSSVVRIGRMAFKKTKLWNDVKNDVVYAGDWAVGYNGTIESITLQIKSSDGLNTRSVKGIADYAFESADTLTQVNGLSSVKIIGKAAFRECTSLGTVALGDNLTEIKDYTFYNCESLNLSNLPQGLISIGRSAFYNCANITSVDFSLVDELSSIGDYAFFGCSGISLLNLGSFVKNIGNYAFFGCSNIETINIPDSVDTLGTRAFNKCEGATSLKIGSGLTKINDYAFVGCNSLSEIVIPDTITEIGRNAFYNCTSVKKLIIGNGVKKIGAYAFSGLSSLSHVEIPVNVSEIGSYAFKGLSSVKSVVLGNSIQKIGAHAFYGLKGVTIYVEPFEQNENWSSKYNTSYRPVIRGCTLDEKKLYVVSVEVKDGFITNQKAEGGITAPERAGYTFKGWSKAADKTTIDYSAADIANAKTGEVLYAVWEPATDTPSAE